MNAFDWLTQATPDEQAVRKMNEEQLAEARRQQREIAELFCDVLHHSPRGPELMAYLRDCTIELPLMDVQRSFVRGDMALAPSDWAFLREGQNSLVRLFEEQIRIALTPEETPAKQEGDDNG
jgi:hypothetical protein